MKKIVLSRGKAYAEVDDADYGLVSEFVWRVVKGRSTHYAYGYVKGKSRGHKIPMHRLIMRPSDSDVVDHVDGNGLNNRRDNLRNCTHVQNLRNRTVLFKNNKSGVTGVWYAKGERKWKAQIYRASRSICLGTFCTKEEAVEARLRYIQAEAWSKL